MKYDEKTGNPIPESRSDEIQITIDKLNKMRKETNGMSSRSNEMCMLLGDINASMAMVVDILSLIYNRMIKEDVENTEEDNGSTEKA